MGNQVKVAYQKVIYSLLGALLCSIGFWLLYLYQEYSGGEGPAERNIDKMFMLLIFDSLVIYASVIFISKKYLSPILFSLVYIILYFLMVGALWGALERAHNYGHMTIVFPVSVYFLIHFLYLVSVSFFYNVREQAYALNDEVG